MSVDFGRLEGGILVERRARPQWFMDDGSPVTDAALAAEGLYPIIDEHPVYDVRKERLVRAPVADWTLVNDQIVVGYTVEQLSIGDRKAVLIQAVGRQAKLIETAGITIGGSTIATDIPSQNRIAGAYAGAQRFPDTMIDFKSESGWVSLDAATMIAIGDAVFVHVQGCFTRERVLTDQIVAAEDHAALNAIEIEAGWPA